MKKFTIKKAGKKGKGLFANQNLKKGERILHVDLTKLKTYTLKEVKKYENKHPSQNHWHWDYVGGEKYIISFQPYSYINHSCKPNTCVKFKAIATSDIYALRDIKKGEELTYDYGVAAMDGFGKDWTMTCRCGEKNCRKKIPADFFKQPLSIQKKYYQNLPPSIKRKYKSKLAKIR